MFLLRVGWGWQVDRQLRAMTDAIRARGEPVELADVQFDPLPDEQNAWVVYANAAAKLNMKMSSPRSSSIESAAYPPYGKEWDALAEASEQAYAGEFGAVRQGRALHTGQLRSRLAPINQLTFTAYTGGRFLANTVADGVAYRHLRGDDAEAVERMRDGLHFGRTLRQDPLLISQVIAVGFDFLACDAIEQAAPSLRIDPAGTDGAATPEQVRALIAELLDEGPVFREFRRAVACERVLTLDYYRTAGATSWALRPAAGRTMIRALEDLEIAARAAAQDNASAARRTATGFHIGDGDGPFGPVSPAAGKKRRVPRYSRWFEDGAMGLDRSVEQMFRVIAERRGAAVILALQLYRADHGTLPDSLTALVPGYLTKVVADAFREDGAPIGYVVGKGQRSDGADRPMVYWDAGETENVPIDPEPMFSWQTDQLAPGRTVRQYRDVTLWVPKVRRFDQERSALQRRAAEERAQQEELLRKADEALRDLETETVDGDPDKSDAPRQDGEADGGGERPSKD